LVYSLENSRLKRLERGRGGEGDVREGGGFSYIPEK